jgi:hypothetical protein
MVEIEETEQANKWGVGRRSLALLVAVALGGFLGAIFFPTVETRSVEKRVEVPVEVIKYVDRVVEKRVEVPVDRVVEKVVEKRVAVPSDKAVIKYVSDRTKDVDGKPSYVINEDRLNLWLQIKVGMTRKQVVSILGPPDHAPNTNSPYGVLFSWGNGGVWFESISSGGLVKSVNIPEY